MTPLRTDVDSALGGLLEALGGDERVRRYKAAREAVRGDLPLWADYCAFKREREAVTAAARSVDYNEERGISNNLWRLTLNDDARELLAAEREVVKLVYGVLEAVVDGVGADGEFWV